MSENTIVAMLAYDDAPAAIDFLCRAFGFTESFRLKMPDGSVGHAELVLGDAHLQLATTWKAGGMASAKDLPAVHSQLNVRVDDVDAHCARAMENGAVIAEEPADQFHGSRSYRALDPEGHRWIFWQPGTEVSPEEMQAQIDAGVEG